MLGSLWSPDHIENDDATIGRLVASDEGIAARQPAPPRNTAVPGAAALVSRGNPMVRG